MGRARRVDPHRRRRVARAGAPDASRAPILDRSGAVTLLSSVRAGEEEHTPPVIASEMLEYAVFGGVLRSMLPFPELTGSMSGAATWTFLVVDGPAPADDALLPLGERALGREHYRLCGSAERLRLEYSHAGVFDISRDGATIVWFRRSDTVMELVRSIVLGPALAIALEQAGLMCLHGSAVAIEGTVVAFVGPKHYGK